MSSVVRAGDPRVAQVPVQERYFAEYRAELARDRDAPTDPDLELLASRHVSPPAVAPHVSGAAIDVTLCDDAALGTADERKRPLTLEDVERCLRRSGAVSGT